MPGHGESFALDSDQLMHSQNVALHIIPLAPPSGGWRTTITPRQPSRMQNPSLCRTSRIEPIISVSEASCIAVFGNIRIGYNVFTLVLCQSAVSENCVGKKS
jgi:hypothetical protein